LTEVQGNGIEGEEYEMCGGTATSHMHEMDGIHDGLVCPTEEELAMLRRVGDAIPWNAYCRLLLFFQPFIIGRQLFQ
jgi:POT family proton-dependent oligopeptide transporter